MSVIILAGAERFVNDGNGSIPALYDIILCSGRPALTSASNNHVQVHGQRMWALWGGGGGCTLASAEGWNL